MSTALIVGCAVGSHTVLTDCIEDHRFILCPHMLLNPISILGATGGTAARPVQNVKVFVSDGSTSFTDEQLLAKDGDLELEFNATVETIPVYTEAQQTFTLADGSALSAQVSDVTLFQF